MMRARWQQRPRTKAQQKNALSSKRTQERQEGTPSSAPQSNTIDINDMFSAKILQKNLVQGELSSGNQTHGTSTRPTVHTERSLAAMALPTHRQKMYRIQNVITTRSGRVGDQNGVLRGLALPTRRMATATNVCVGTWTRSRARKNGQ